MTTAPITYTLMSVHQSPRAAFATRLVPRPPLKVVGRGAVAPGACNREVLGVGFRYLLEHPGVRRLFVPLLVDGFSDDDGDWHATLLGMTPEVRAKIYLEVPGSDSPFPETVVKGAHTAQERYGVSVAVTVDRPDETSMQSAACLTPAVVMISGKAIKPALHKHQTSLIIDAVETCHSIGAYAMVDGIDSRDDFDELTKRGIDLVCGRAISTFNTLNVKKSGQFGKARFRTPATA